MTRLAWLRTLACVFAALVVVPGTAAASFLQDGFEAARTGGTRSKAPDFLDVAFRRTLPGAATEIGAPVVVDRFAYVAVHPCQQKDPSLNESAVYRIGLDTGSVERFIDVPWPLGTTVPDRCGWFRYSLSSDGQRLFLVHNHFVRAYSLPDADLQWEWQVPAPYYEMYCAAPAIDATTVFVGCSAHVAQGDREVSNRTGLDAMHRIVLLAFDTVKGFLWSWEDPETAATGSSLPTQDRNDWVAGLAVVGDAVLLSLEDGQGQSVTGRLVAVHKTTGGFLHEVVDDEQRWVASQVLPYMTAWIGTGYIQSAFGPLASLPVGDGSHVYWRKTFWHDIDLRDWQDDAQAPPDPETGATSQSAGPALVDGQYYFGTATTLFRLDTRSGQLERFFELPAGRFRWANGPFLIAGSTLFALAHEWHEGPAIGAEYGTNAQEFLSTRDPNDLAERNFVEREVLFALDLDSGRTAWQEFRLTPRVVYTSDDFQWGLLRPYTFAVSDGLVVVAGKDGQFVVLGRTAASIPISVRASTEFPGVGETFYVSVEGAGRGVDGPPSRFGVQWTEDGEIEVQDGGRFEHAYAAAGAVRARFFAINDADQSTSQAFTFVVGGSPVSPADRAAVAQNVQDGADAPELLGFLAPESGPVVLAMALVGVVALLAVPLLIFLVLRRRSSGAPGADRYVVERELGRGAYSRTLLARDRVLDRPVVLKQSTAPWLMADESRKQFLKEARLLARLQHPNVVTVHEVLAGEGPPALVLEYVAGGSLADLLAKERRLPASQVWSYANGILLGLQHIHQAGIIHRDVKPANILLAADRAVKVSDLGIAKPPKGVESMTLAATRHQPGSPLYMSPEQARGDAVDARTDLYAAAAVVFEMLTGQHYLAAAVGPEFRLRLRIEEETPDVARPEIPARVRRVLARALAKDPADRFPTAAAMRTALEDAIQETEEEGLPRPVRRHSSSGDARLGRPYSAKP